jgi:hypothetical protein
MTMLQVLTLFSAGFGAVGSGLLFFSTYGLEPYEGAVWGSDAVTQHNVEVDKRKSPTGGARTLANSVAHPEKCPFQDRLDGSSTLDSKLVNLACHLISGR